MTEYVITVVPVVEEGFSGPVSQTMVRIDVGGDQPIVRELTMRVSQGSGLITGKHRYYIDFETLLRAFVPTDGAPLTTTERPAEPARESTAQPASRRAPASRRGRAKSSAGRNATAARTSHLRSGRAYRKAPDPAELEAAYLESGTINGVAEHFGVPVHTAQGWISRMRRNYTADQ
jgi:hypothetical protein